MTPENRTKHLAQALGYQGGTIHQFCEEIGCNANDFLYKDLPDGFQNNQDFLSGWYAANAGTLEHNKEFVFPKKKGILIFWLGVICGQRVRELGD